MEFSNAQPSQHDEPYTKPPGRRPPPSEDGQTSGRRDVEYDINPCPFDP